LENEAVSLMLNYSMHSADRITHLKIVVVAMLGATLVAGIGVAARASSLDAEDEVRRIETMNGHDRSERKITIPGGGYSQSADPIYIPCRKL